MIGAVGLDPLTAQERFTFGMVELSNGISFVAVMIGLFGVSEALTQLHHLDKAAIKQKVDKIVPPLSVIWKYLPLSMQTSAIGVIVGALPGTGGDIAALLAYDHAKRVTKHPEVPFGQGAKEGLVGPQTANNAAVGGAFIPMLTLGIPGDAVTAIFIGALCIHGLNPGPMLMIDRPHLGYFMKIYGYQIGPVILGVILSQLIDENWRRGIISEQGSLSTFFVNLVWSPLSLVLLIAVILIFMSKTPVWSMVRRAIGGRAAR
ncbi:MAG: tripartite tricarboxylate transporter permease [Rhodospirillales bacterium]|nr:tripartite tricarboxylate transporter permease [Rhodospirillales bacterium]